VPVDNIEEVASRIWSSAQMKVLIANLHQNEDKHPVAVPLLLNGILPRFLKLRILQELSLHSRTRKDIWTAAHSAQVEALSREISEVYSYLLPTAKGPRRKKYSKDEINDLLLRAIRDAGIDPLTADKIVRRELKKPLPPGRPPTARHSALLAIELMHNESGITMRQIADRICPCGNKQHKPRCECLRTLRKEIQGLNRFMEENGL
jgi:hypothetical protein